MKQGQVPERLAKKPRHRPPSIRRLLLVTINVVLVLGLTILLVVDYRRNVAQRIFEKRIALHEEAQTLTASIQALQHHELGELQAYLDSVCARMLESSSPGHHIALRLGDVVLQAQSHHRASPAFLTAMQIGSSSPDGRTSVKGKPIIVASDRDGDLVVSSVSHCGSAASTSHRPSQTSRPLARRVDGILTPSPLTPQAFLRSDPAYFRSFVSSFGRLPR